MSLFNRYTIPGKGIKKGQIPQNFGIRHFFSVLRDKFWKLVILNLLFFLVNLPVFGLFAYLAGVGGVPYPAPASVLYQPLWGVVRHGQTPAFQALQGVLGVQVIHRYPTYITYSLLGAGLLVLLTFGAANAAMTRIQRDFVRGDPVSVGEDFFWAIRDNYKQAIILGLVDIGFVFVFLFDVVNYLYANQTFGFLVLLYATFFIFLIYLFMRPYLYLQCVTFDVKIPKMIKNAWILAIAGIRRNLLCFIVSALIATVNVVLFTFVPSLGVGMLFIFTVSLAWFLQVFGAWPVLKKHMIDPFYEEKAPASSGEEVIFEDHT